MSELKQDILWEVFVQAKPGLAFKHSGSLHAYDKEQAMQNARDLYTRRKEGCAIWIVKSDAIVASDPNNSDSLFDPSNDKVYRHPTFYELPEGTKHM